MAKSTVLKPRLSEKVYAQSEQLNTYVFDVDRSLNKHGVAEAVKKQYQVEVATVRLAGARGKSQRSVRHGGRSIRRFQRSNVRKAYVSLKEGHKLPIFAAMEESAGKPADKEKQ